MTPNNFTRLEDPEYGKHTLSSLKRIAAALDVALVVRFVPFSQYIDWISGTPHLDPGIRPEALAVPSFEDEEKKGGWYETGVNVTQYIPYLGYPSAGLVTPYIPLSGSIEMYSLYQSQTPSPIPVPVPLVLVSEVKVAA